MLPVGKRWKRPGWKLADETNIKLSWPVLAAPVNGYRSWWAKLMHRRQSGIHGLAEENEDIRVHVVSREQAYQWVKRGKSTTQPLSSPCNGCNCIITIYEMSGQNERYTPDFPEMMRLCETNFAQLRRLLPRTDAAGEKVSYQVGSAQYRLTIVESTRYTTLVAIEQTLPAVKLLEPAIDDRSPLP